MMLMFAVGLGRVGSGVPTSVVGWVGLGWVGSGVPTSVAGWVCKLMGWVGL